MSSGFTTIRSGQAPSLGLLGCSATSQEPRSAQFAESGIVGRVDGDGEVTHNDVPHRGDVSRREPVRNGSSRAERIVRLHRVADVRVQQGISQRTVARRLGMELKKYKELEKPDHDLSLSELLALQVALEVPLVDLLEDRQALSRPVAERAKMIKVMKTAAAIREIKSSPRIERMAQMLCEQLIDLMPELAEVSSWPQFGARRGPTAMGKALCQPIDTSDLRLPE